MPVFGGTAWAKDFGRNGGMGRNDFNSEIFHFSSERKKAVSATTHEQSN